MAITIAEKVLIVGGVLNLAYGHCPKVFRVMRSCVWFLRAGHGLAAC